MLTDFQRQSRIKDALTTAGPDGMTKRQLAVATQTSITNLGPLLHNLLLSKEISKRTLEFSVLFSIAASSNPT